jgi:WD40 repeat protein
MLATEQATTAHKGEVLSCAYSDDGVIVLTAGWDGGLRCWDSQTGRALSVIESGGGPVPACAISSMEGHWLAGSLEGLFSIWDPVTHSRLTRVLPHTRPITAIAVSPSGHQLATSSYDQKVVLFPKPDQPSVQRVLVGHRDCVLGCTFSPDGSTLLSWSADNTVRLWDTSGATVLAELDCGDKVNCAVASPDGLWVVSGTDGGRVQLWDLDRLTIVQSRVLRDPLVGCFFMHGQEFIIAVDGGGRLTLFSMPNLEQAFEFVNLESVRTCACSPLGDQVVLAGSNGRPHLVGLEGARPIAVRPVVQDRSVFWRLLGRQVSYGLKCPLCSASFSWPRNPSGSTIACPACKASLTVTQDSRAMVER